MRKFFKSVIQLKPAIAFLLGLATYFTSAAQDSTVPAPVVKKTAYAKNTFDGIT